MTALNNPFRKELKDFLSLRQASPSKNACHYLADFDTFAAGYTNEKFVSEALIND